MRKILYKIISTVIILIIFFFLGKELIDNWQKIRLYQFSFNYFYLFISFILFGLSLILPAIVWNKILEILESQKKLSNFKALKFYAYSWLGRYVPGKAWMYMARVYLGAKEGISKKSLTVSVIYEIVLSVAAAFWVSFVLIIVGIGRQINGSYFIIYIIPITAVVGGMIFIHPKIFPFFFNFALRKIKQDAIPKDNFLNYLQVVKLFLYYSLIFIFNGCGFFFLIRSITLISFNNVLAIAGFYILASVLGMVMIFAPSGLGIREGTLVVFLKSFFPTSIGVLISLLARVWSSIGELFVLGGVFLLAKIMDI